MLAALAIVSPMLAVSLLWLAGNRISARLP